MTIKIAPLKTGGLNTRDPTRQAFEKMLRQTPFRPAQERDWMRDVLNKPFRPTRDMGRSPVPRIPFAVQTQLQTRAQALARRMLARPIPALLFRELLKFALEELIRAFFDWLTKRGGQGGWEVVATVAAPNPLYNGQVSYSGAFGYPMGQTQKNFVNVGLTTGCGTYPSLMALPPTFGNAIMMKKGPSICQYNVGYQRRTGWLPQLPFFWEEIDRGIEFKKQPPPKVQEYLKDQWKNGPDQAQDNRPNSIEEDTPKEQEAPQTGKQITVNPKTGSVRQQVTQHRPTRTKAGTKEKKFAGTSQTIQTIFRYLSQIKEAITEFDDLFDVFIDSMPKSIQKLVPKNNGRGAAPDQKLAFIYKHFDKVDWNQFVDNFILNQIEDKAVGTAIALSDKAALKRGATNTVGSRFWMHQAR